MPRRYFSAIASSFVLLSLFVPALCGQQGSASGSASTSGEEKKLPDPKRWEATIAKFEEADKKTPPPESPIVFTGSSSIAGWKDLAEHFSEHKVLNRGFGGSILPDVNTYLDRVVIKYRPRTVVLYCGSNDLAGGQKPQQVLESFQKFVATIHAQLPETRIIYISIHLPPGRLNQVDKITETNKLISSECKKSKKLAYLDIHNDMLDKDGKPNPELYKDALHPNVKGYEIWASKLRPMLKE